MAEMKLIGAVGIKVRPVAKKFKEELNDQLRNLPDKEVHVKVDADTRAADKAIKDTKDKAEREHITLTAGVNYDGLRNAQQQIRQALKRVGDEPLQLKFDTNNLEKGLAGIKKRLDNAEVQMHVAQDDAGFRAVLAKIEQIRRAKTEIGIKFYADDKDLRRQEKETRAELERAIINKGIKIQYVEDREGLASAIKTIDDALRNLKRVEINPKLNKEALQAERDRLQAELDSKPATIKINKDVDGYTAALNKIRALQREAAQVTFRYKTDKEGLAKAAEQLEKWQKAAIERAGITISYNNNRSGLESAIGELDKELAKFKQLTINPKLNEAALLKQKAKLQKDLDAIPLTVSYNEDREGFKKAIAQLETLQREAARVELQYKNDPAGLEAALDLMRQKLDAEPVTVGLIPDKKGYETVLGQIEELQRQAKAIDFQYNTDEQGLKDAADKLRKSIAELPVPVKFKYDNDSMGIRGALAEVEQRLKEVGRIELTAELNEADLLAKKADLEQLLKDSSFEIKVNSKDLDALKKERDKLNQLLREANGEEVSLDVAMDEESMRHAKKQIEELIHDAERNPVNLDVEPVGLALAASQIGWASRSRVVPFFIRIDNKSRAVAEGVLKSLSGYNTLSSIGRTVESVATNFDTTIAKGGALTSVLANIVNTLGYAVTNTLSIGDGMAQVIGLAATAPAALSAAAAVVLVNVAAFRDFKGAIDGSAEAMSKLPPQAQAAAVALRGTWEAIQQPIQNAYWESMGTSLQDMVDVMLPKVRDGLALAGGYIGLFAKNTADTLAELGRTDMFDRMFGYLGTFFKESAGIADPLTRALNTIGLRGAEYLPQFGIWLTDITTQFNEWIQKADQAGDINRWIEEGVDSLQNMWRAGDGALDVIRAITKASMAAGGTTLSELADEMQRWGEIASGEPFQTRLTKIFAGARQGASNLNAGFMDLTRSVGESAHWLSDVLEILGRLGGVTLSNFSTMFRNDTFKGGVYEAIQGLTDMMTALRPSFDSLSTVIGVLGSTAAATFRGLAPLINVVTGALETVMEILGDELPGIATALTGQLTNTFSSAALMVTLLARAVEPVLKAFLAMPEAIQSILLAAGGFMIMRGQISKMFTALNDKGHFKRFEGSWKEARAVVGTEANRMQVAGQMMIAGTQQMVDGTGSALTGAKASWANYTTAVKNAEGGLKTIGTAMMMPVQKAASGIKAGLGSLVGFLGGPVGAALTVATIGVTLFAAAQQKAKAHIDGLSASLNQQTGELGENSKAMVADNWMQLNTSKWDDFWRGAVKGSKAAHEAVAALGDSTADITDMIAEGGPAYEKYIDNLELIEKHLGDAKQGKASGMYGEARMSMEELAKATGYTVKELDRMNVMDISNLRGQMESGREAMAKAEERVKGVAGALRVGESEAATMAEAIKVLGDESSTASERVDAMKSALDRLKGGGLSQQEAARNFAKAWDSALEQIRSANTNAETGQKESFGHLIDDVDGHILDLRGKGGELYDATKSIANSMLENAMAAQQHVLDNKGTMAEAQAAALAELTLSKDQLAEWADAMGVSVGEAELMLSNFMANDWQMSALLSADNELFLKSLADATARGEEFGQEEWEAILRTRNLADIGIEEAKANGENWADTDFSAVLRAMPDDAIRTLNETLGIVDEGWLRGDFTAQLKALDGTSPGVAQALLSIAMVTDGDYAAEIQALIDALSLDQANAELDGAANAERSANITAVPHTFEATTALNMTADPRKADITGVPHTEVAAQGLNNTALPRNSFFIGVPNTRNAEGNLNNTARQRDPWFYGHANVNSSNRDLNNAAAQRTAPFRAAVDEGSRLGVLGTLANMAAERIVSFKAKMGFADGGVVGGNGVQLFANGGLYSHQVVKAYANGGTENHTAQIARGGTPYRVWAEPETGGEAYIPLSLSKRARSTQILEQVAQQFGLKLSRNDVTQFANGGIVDGGRTGGGVAVNIGSYVAQNTDTPDDVARALMRRIKAQGAYSPLEAF